MEMLQAIEKFTEWRSYKVGKFTLRGYDGQLRQFCIFMRNPDIENITFENVMEYLIMSEKVAYKQNALMPKAEAIKQLLKFFKRLGYKVIEPDLIPIPQKEYNKPKTATQEEHTTLLAAMDFLEQNSLKRGNFPDRISIWRNRAILCIAWDTGARVGEILALKLEDLSFTDRKAIIRTEKSRGRRPFREIFWTQKTNDLIGKWLEGRKEYFQDRLHDREAVFIGVKGWNLGNKIGNGAIHAFLKFYSRVAGLPRTVNIHSYRHHKGHDVINRGGSGADVMNILGHASVSSSMVYTMMHDTELGNRAKKFMDEELST